MPYQGTLSRAVNVVSGFTGCGKTLVPGLAPDFRPGCGVSNSLKRSGNKIQALALVAASEAVSDFPSLLALRYAFPIRSRFAAG